MLWAAGWGDRRSFEPYPNVLAPFTSLIEDRQIHTRPSGASNSLSGMSADRTPCGRFYTKQVLCRMPRSPTDAAKIEHKGKLHDARWKPIRSWETHERIQQMMDKNDWRKRSDKRQSRDYVYLLAGESQMVGPAIPLRAFGNALRRIRLVER